ncbi:thiamine pyrophosphate-binding protein [Pseudosulfitobacter sp. DSM 107133]|uniref:thiamine pyrophosphate-binding protein n=1 Tax=Pseudosulfitobacter sp. DSM 107133 TaxID=2883100 RepID=UPI001963ED57|nr:thiamine pyrophosphate-binding protein [Pseudosulfitobacter sp. DSM 107133]UOA26127.1 Acetolactate synthase [Pseudosulfitobacter sp. DSM 107133]
MTKTIRAADAVARRLYDAGCRMAFGMPGGEVLTMVDALEAAGITFVLCKHENAAAFMAEGAWHRTGAPGVLVATVGPGVLNGVNAVANALQDRVPLIVLAGAVDADEAQSYTHQVLDQRAVFAPITKATFLLDTGAAHVIADKAVSIATEGQPGPVFIDIPIRVAEAQVPADAATSRAVAADVVPDAATLAQIAGWLSQAARPIIIAGVDALNECADVAGLARRFGVPVITTYKAKGMLPEDDPLALGGAGLSPLADKTLLPLVQNADLVLCLGYDPIEMRTGWRDVWDSTAQRVVEVTAVPNHHYMHQSTVNIVGSVRATVAALMLAATPRATWAGGEVAAAQAALAAAFPTDEDWGPAAIVATCRTALPRDTLATADSGAHRILLSQMWQCYAPRGLMQSSALCTMGCAAPLAMGAALASPDRTVVSFSGDAGFLMVAGELATARELGLRCIFVVFVDASLALIELKQRQRQLGNHGVDFGTHDFAAIGRAFGGAGVDVRSRAELQSALQDAQSADTFTVIAAHIEKGAYDGRI